MKTIAFDGGFRKSVGHTLAIARECQSPAVRSKRASKGGATAPISRELWDLAVTENNRTAALDRWALAVLGTAAVMVLANSLGLFS